MTNPKSAAFDYWGRLAYHFPMLSHVHKPELHLFRHQARWFCLNVGRGRCEPVSSLEREILTLPEGTPIPTVIRQVGERHGEEAVQKALLELERRHLLLESTKAAYTSQPRRPRCITRLVLNVAEGCNLRCRYCIVGQGRLNGRGALMRQEVALRGVDFLLKVSGNSPRCHIEFSGGEPLLNFGLIRETVRYGRAAAERQGRQITYSVTTNGTLLDEERISFLKQNGVEVGISLDGPPEVHDRFRIFPDGSGSYQAVTSRLPSLLADYADKVHARTLITQHQTGVIRTLNHIMALGFRSIRIGHMNGRGDGDFQAAAARRKLKAAYTRLAHRFLARAGRGDLSAGYPFVPYLLHFCSGRPRRAFCDAGQRMLGLAPDGGLYPCHIFAQLPEYRLGDVWTMDTPLDGDRLEQLIGLDVDSRPVCRHCWARYICGGGCLYLAARENGDAHIPSPVECELTRHVIQLSAWIHCQLREKAPVAFVDLLAAEGRWRPPVV